MEGFLPQPLKDVHMKISSIPSSMIEPFSNQVIKLLDLTSQKIFAMRANREELFPIAFYCRKSNLLSLKERYNNRLSCGTSLFICPKNVDVLSCYAVVFGILTGNFTVVRPSNSELFLLFTEILFNATKELGFSEIFDNFKILDPQNELDLVVWSQMSNVRVAWGGNNSIQRYASMKTSVDCRDVFFPHRDSIAIIDCNSINDIDELATLFCQCAYSFKQSSCSSPRFVYFLHCKTIIIEEFWNKVAKIVKEKWDFSPINIIDKYYYLCKYLSKYQVQVKTYNNFVYTIEGKVQDVNMEPPRGWGTFITINVDTILDCFRGHKQLQTISYYGLDKHEIWAELVNSSNTSVTRIVPFDKVLEFNHIVDGVDIIERLTRQITLY